MLASHTRSGVWVYANVVYILHRRGHLREAFHYYRGSFDAFSLKGVTLSLSSSISVSMTWAYVTHGDIWRDRNPHGMDDMKYEFGQSDIDVLSLWNIIHLNIIQPINFNRCAKVLKWQYVVKSQYHDILVITWFVAYWLMHVELHVRSTYVDRI